MLYLLFSREGLLLPFRPLQPVEEEPLDLNGFCFSLDEPPELNDKDGVALTVSLGNKEDEATGQQRGEEAAWRQV